MDHERLAEVTMASEQDFVPKYIARYAARQKARRRRRKLARTLFYAALLFVFSWAVFQVLTAAAIQASK